VRQAAAPAEAPAAGGCKAAFPGRRNVDLLFRARGRGDDLRPVVGGSIRLTLRVGTACARATMVRRTSHKDFVFP